MNKKNILGNFFLIISIATTLSGCSNEKKLTEEVTVEFGKILSDPSSLQLRNVKYFRDETTCGEFNAKNDRGGYVGFQPFVYQKTGVLGGEEYESALGRVTLNPIYSDLVHKAVRVDMAEKALSKFNKVALAIGGESKSRENKIWQESVKIWCSDAKPSEKLKNGKAEFVNLLIQTYSDSYISGLETECSVRKQKSQLYAKTLELGAKLNLDLFSMLAAESKSACKIAERARNIAKNAKENLLQLSKTSTE
jgi:hypothetical protein